MIIHESELRRSVTSSERRKLLSSRVVVVERPIVVRLPRRRNSRKAVA